MKARRVQLVRCNVQAPVRAAVTESAHDTSDVEGGETKLIQHGVSVPSDPNHALW